MPMKKQVFIIDDDPISIVILKKNLELVEVTQKITTFSNGKDALNHLKKEYKTDENYTIFLDINMPILSGFDTADQLLTLARADAAAQPAAPTVAQIPDERVGVLELAFAQHVLEQRLGVAHLQGDAA